MISDDKNGGRTVHLYIPFEFAGRKIESIALAPLRFGHVIRWGEGAWRSSVEMLTELAGVEENIIRELRYPDADRVMEAFMSLLTPEIRDDVANGRIPMKPEQVTDQRIDDLTENIRTVTEAARGLTNGQMARGGPGDPLPPPPIIPEAGLI